MKKGDKLFLVAKLHPTIMIVESSGRDEVEYTLDVTKVGGGCCGVAFAFDNEKLAEEFADGCQVIDFVIGHKIKTK
jgi:hypothetical protein